MANTRIKDLTTVSTAGGDDYLVIDGETNGTRKILASNVGGGAMSEYVCNSGNTISVGQTLLRGFTVADSSVITPEDFLKIKAYGVYSNGPTTIYTVNLIPEWRYDFSTTSIRISFHNFFYSGSAMSMVVHIIAPFEITADVSVM